MVAVALKKKRNQICPQRLPPSQTTFDTPATTTRSLELRCTPAPTATRRLHAEIAPLALAYEAALISGLAPHEVALLKRLLLRLQGAAGVLAGEAPSAG